MKGSNYGLNENFQYLEIELDSAEAIVAADGRQFYASTSTNVIYDNPLFKISGRQPLKNIAALKVLEVQIPFTWYTLSGSFALRVVGMSVVNTTITIPQGNYTASSLIALLNSLTTATATGAYTDVLWRFNSTTGKIEVALDLVPAPGLNILRLDFSADDPLGRALGLTGIRQYFPTTNQQYFSFDTVALLSGPNYLYLNSNTLGPLVNLYLPRVSQLGGNSGPQVAKIPVNVSPGGIIYWQDPDPQKWFEAENLQNLDSIDMFLSLGLSRDVLALNGASFSVKLGILLWTDEETDYAGGSSRAVTKRIRSA